MIKAAFQIKCPECRSIADFINSNQIKVKKKDKDYFLQSKFFKLHESGFSKAQRTSYYTLHYPLLMPKLENISDLPEGYTAEYWRSSYREYGGVLNCSSCNTCQIHILNWPDDAYFQLDYKGKTLWAYDRSYAIKLRDYIKSGDRKKRHPASTETYIFQDYFLRKIPEHFQTKKARDEIVSKLNKLLR